MALTDERWAALEPLVEEARPKGKTPPRDLRRTIGAIVWRARSMGETHSEEIRRRWSPASRRSGSEPACASPTSSSGFPGNEVSSAPMTLAIVRP